MTHPCDARARVVASPARHVDVIDLAARTSGHIAYAVGAPGGETIARGGDTLADLRTWKNEFR